MQKINNLPDKICQPPPLLLGIKLSYPNEFSHIRYKKTTPFVYLSCKWTVSVRKMVSWIVHMLKNFCIVLKIVTSNQFNVNYSESLLFKILIPIQTLLIMYIYIYIAISGCLCTSGEQLTNIQICGLFCDVLTFCRSFFVLLVAK